MNKEHIMEVHHRLRLNGRRSSYSGVFKEERETIIKLFVSSFDDEEARAFYLRIRPQAIDTYESIERHHNRTAPTSSQYMRLLSLENDKEYLKSLKNLIIKNGEYTRNKDGDILPESYFVALKSKLVAKKTLRECIERDDLEAWSVISNYSFMDKVYKDRELVLRWILNNEPAPGSKMFSELYIADKKDPLSIAQTLIKSSLKRSSDSALGAYDSSVAKPYGHHIICAILKKAGRLSSKGNRLLLEKLIEDGADLFVGYKMAMSSAFVYEPFLSRKRAPAAEAEYMNKAILSVPAVNIVNKNNLLKSIELYSNTCPPEKEEKNASDVMSP